MDQSVYEIDYNRLYGLFRLMDSVDYNMGTKWTIWTTLTILTQWTTIWTQLNTVYGQNGPWSVWNKQTVWTEWTVFRVGGQVDRHIRWWT